MASALEQLAASPYYLSIEKVFVIGGGQILKEAINAPGCDAIHITEIETSFNVTSSSLILIPWYFILGTHPSHWWKTIFVILS